MSAMVTPAYGDPDTIPAGACGWPNHDEADCAKCAVMRACLAQVDLDWLPPVQEAMRDMGDLWVD